jgi:hypothetical protein
LLASDIERLLSGGRAAGERAELPADLDQRALVLIEEIVYDLGRRVRDLSRTATERLIAS